MILINIVILLALLKLLLASEKPLLCSGIYTVVCFVFGLFSVLDGHAPFYGLLLYTAVRFGLSFLYFWLLCRIGGEHFLVDRLDPWISHRNAVSGAAPGTRARCWLRMGTVAG